MEISDSCDWEAFDEQITEILAQSINYTPVARMGVLVWTNPQGVQTEINTKEEFIRLRAHAIGKKSSPEILLQLNVSRCQG